MRNSDSTIDLTNLQAALGMAQLGAAGLVRRQEDGRWANSTMRPSLDVPELEIPPSRTDYAENIYWVYGMVLADRRPDWMPPR